MSLIIALLFTGCIGLFPNDKAASFPDNPLDDFDRDGLTEQLGDCDDLNPDIIGPITFYKDGDDDGFGDPTESIEDCVQPSGYVENSDDCNDASAEIYPGSARNEPLLCTKDSDGDGYGDMTPEIVAEAGTDCDDDDARTYPGNNFEPGVICIFDADSDGFGDMNPPAPFDSGSDCDDLTPQTNPWGLETCDEQDNDCDGETDEQGALGAPIWYKDADGDGFGTEDVLPLAQCGLEAPEGYSSVALDCDDSDPQAFPGNAEQCDGIDNDCNSQIDEGVLLTFYSDLDGDGYGSPVNSTLACSAPSTFVDNTDDCDDNDSAQFPGAPEYCNGEDDNCDGQTDEDSALDVQTWYYDADGDSYGNPGATLVQCYQATNYVAQAEDCDDDDPLQNPNAIELCNNEDDDCNGIIDDDPEGQLPFYLDFDGDGDGDSTDLDGDGTPDNMIIACPIYTPLAEPPAGYSATGGDCDDSNDSRSSLHPELCTTLIDENCDGSNTLGATDVTLWFADTDADGFGNGATNINGNYLYTLLSCPNNVGGPPIGYSINGLDCNDNDGEMYPGAIEVCNGKLQNCDLAEDDSYGPLSEERDDDGDGYIECEFDPATWAVVSTLPYGWGDCQDDDIDVYPGAPERCTGEVEDCDSPDYGTIPDDEFDDDDDGYVECSGWVPGNWEGQSTVIGGDDCNDANTYTFPGAAELESDQNLCAQDADEDGYADCVRWQTNTDQPGPADYYCEYGIFLNTTIGPDFVRIPAGDDPLGRYTLTNDFFMMTTEVTQAMFETLVGNNPSFYTNNGPNIDNDRPAESLSWYEAAHFANLLSDYDGLDRCYNENNSYQPFPLYSGTLIYDCPGYRLPTEGEWEYAGRSESTFDIWTPAGGATITDESGNCPFQASLVEGSSNNGVLGDYAWYCGNALTTQHVAQLLPNGFGLYDMHGNVSEWVNDSFLAFDAFPSSNINPAGFNGNNKLNRGSSFGSWDAHSAVDIQQQTYPYGIYSSLGFRVVRTAP